MIGPAVAPGGGMAEVDCSPTLENQLASVAVAEVGCQGCSCSSPGRMKRLSRLCALVKLPVANTTEAFD